jgi:hypothetical protein
MGASGHSPLACIFSRPVLRNARIPNWVSRGGILQGSTASYCLRMKATALLLFNNPPRLPQFVHDEKIFPFSCAGSQFESKRVKGNIVLLLFHDPNCAPPSREPQSMQACYLIIAADKKRSCIRINKSPFGHIFLRERG